MRKLVAFNNMTLDGYFADTNGDISWAHKDTNDAEFNAFVGTRRHDLRLTGAAAAHAASGDHVRHILTPLVLAVLVVASWALRAPRAAS